MARGDHHDDDDDKARRIEGEELLFGLDFDSLGNQVIDFGDTSTPTTKNKELRQQADDDAVDQASMAKIHAIKQLLLTPLAYNNIVSDDSPANDDDFYHLFEWATQRGAILDSIRYGRDTHGGRGLYATCDIAKGGIVAILPRELRLGQKLACQRIQSLPHDTPDLSALSLMILEFCGCCRCCGEKKEDDDVKNHNDEWRIYAKTLPRRKEFTNAVVMTEEEINKWVTLGGEKYASAIRNVRGTAEACVSYIRDYLLSTTTSIESNNNKNNNREIISTQHDDDTTSAIYWAIAMVLSRSHAFGTQRSRWLTPVLDLANHCPASQGGGELVTDDQGRLVLRAGKDLVCGDEVTLDYQERRDEQLVATYGFSLCLSP